MQDGILYDIGQLHSYIDYRTWDSTLYAVYATHKREIKKIAFFYFAYPIGKKEGNEIGWNFRWPIFSATQESHSLIQIVSL